MGLMIYPSREPRGIVASMECGSVPSGEVYIGNTETMLFTQQFIAEPGRNYRVTFQMGSVDANGTGTNASAGAKNSALTSCRWASGSSVTTSGTLVGQILTPLFSDDSGLSGGVVCESYIRNPPAGLTTVGISLYTNKTATASGSARYLAFGSSAANIFAVEDVGPAF
ncbi:DUF7298 domain-containing protein [Streptomyces sp. NBC_01198]|uniref:DUF7298 domain-containing protein n=1 Tax=Streptomyces sp. NBC_01198 TaxID=2903769 RepID=UPI002E158EF8|nr:hypothetical protein OG702_31990 [Streptomyces sp. NBC_01198]